MRIRLAHYSIPMSTTRFPIIAGTNEEEYKLFLTAYYDVWPSCQYQFTADAMSAGWTLEAVDAPATILASHPSQPGVYAYQFLYGMYRHDGLPSCAPDPAAYNAWLDLSPFGMPNFGLMLGASHALEINFFFGNYWFGDAGPFLFRPDNRPGWEITEAMMAYVAEFAYTGSPGDAGGVMWSPWSNTPGAMKRILLDANDEEALIEMSPE